MRKILIFIGALVALTASAFAQDEEAQATPTFRRPPPYPATCLPETAENPSPQSVSLIFDVNRKGQVENVRVSGSTNPCFEEAASVTARTWEYEPRRVDGVPTRQENLEVTVTFVLNQENNAEDIDASPFVRVPPEYPDRCVNVSSALEVVKLRFDVTAEGSTEKIEVLETSQRCLNKSAVNAVKKWRYRPKLVDGKANRRVGVETEITFHLNRTRHSPDEYKIRSSVHAKLMKAQKLGKKDKTLGEALALLKQLRIEYGESFSHAELAVFHQVRGIVRLQASEYHGALDDLRIVQRTGTVRDSIEGVAETIDILEATLGLEPDRQPLNSDQRDDDSGSEPSDR